MAFLVTFLVLVTLGCSSDSESQSTPNSVATSDIGVATGSEPSAPNYPPGEWLEEKGWPYDWMLDGIDPETESWTVASAYGVSGFPAVVVLGDDGTVLTRWSGQRGATEIIAAVESVLA